MMDAKHVGLFDLAERRLTWTDRRQVLLAQNNVDLSAFERRPDEVLLRADLLDHRLIDVPAAELVQVLAKELQAA